MKDKISCTLTSILVIVGIVLGLSAKISLNDLQISTLKILMIVNLVSIIYCFVVGEITRNNSQMDKLWSILPIIYMFIITVKSSFNIRIVLMTILVTLWGARLTYNFAKKGAYTIKFWEGEEDYRWKWLRETKIFKDKKILWALFDLFFISIYQNILVLLICLPTVVCMTSNKFSLLDVVAAILVLGFIILETIADKQQMIFQTEKWRMLKEGKKLNELPKKYSKGFITEGLWSKSRHPNYFSEQAIWLSLYLFSIKESVFNWSIVGSLLLVLLFIGSSTLGEYISSSKYPEYKKYRQKINRFIPLSKYQEK